MKTLVFIKKLLLFTLFISVGAYINAQSIQFSNEEIAEIKRVEKANYEKACELNTIDAFKEYLKLYEAVDFASKEHKVDIKNRICDYNLWSKAKATNKNYAYNSYLRDTKYSIYTAEARKAIQDLKSEEEWSKIKYNDNINELEVFINENGKSIYISEAKSKLNQLKAVDCYNAGEYINAFNYFNLAGGKKIISDENKIKYDKAEEFYEYHNIVNKEFTDINLEAYLIKYPNSEFYNNVSNMLAISKASKFTRYSKKSALYAALKYAQDKYTIKQVRQYFKKAK